MSQSRRWLAWGLSAALLLSGASGLSGAAQADESTLPRPIESYFVVGTFQQEGSVVSASRPLEGQVEGRGESFHPDWVQVFP